MKVFVYGTLMGAHGNNRLLRGARFLGEGVLPNYGIYYSFGDGGFPVSRYEPRSSTIGEVWEIDPEVHLDGLDSLEGYDPDYDCGMYVRRTGQAHFLSNGEGVEVSFYLGGDTWDFDTMKPCPISTEGHREWTRG